LLTNKKLLFVNIILMMVIYPVCMKMVVDELGYADSLLVRFC
jgi:hypothetical protein